MDAHTIQMARDSLTRCRKDAAFLDRFYELFVASSAEIRDKFSQTDFERQKSVLSDSLFLMLSAAGTTEGYAHAQLERLAKRHNRNALDIKPEWYALWLDCLIQAVAEHDPEFTELVESSWRDSLQGGIDLLIAGY